MESLILYGEVKDMGTTYYLFFIVFILLIFTGIEYRKVMVAQKLRKRKKGKKETKFMESFAKQFIGKECLIYIMSGSSANITGIIKEVQDGGMLVEGRDKQLQVINLDYVTRIMEYPRKKNGKKKSLVWE